MVHVLPQQRFIKNLEGGPGAAQGAASGRVGHSHGTAEEVHEYSQSRVSAAGHEVP